MWPQTAAGEAGEDVGGSVAEEGDGGHEERAGDEDEGESESLPSDEEHDEGDEEQGGVTIIGLVQGQALTLVHTRGRCWVLLGGPWRVHTSRPPRPGQVPLYHHLILLTCVAGC